jgi:A/G-specific adenine glycosylase
MPLVTQPHWRQRIRRNLLRWYQRHARELPWRLSSDPYHVWVSEIMLQQTQVATVERYFTRFIATLPTVRALAEAREQEVLRLWEGLGYYRRARQLHRAARQVVAHHGGQLPAVADQLIALPGIGRYTAGAILSIAFDIPAAILETNSIRLLTRLAGYREDPTRAQGQRDLWDLAQQLLPRTRVGTFNQALMELGSTVCTPREPRCDRCPLASLCAAQAHDLQTVIPMRKATPPIESVREATVVVSRRGRVLLLQYGPGQRWSGLWDFPRFPLTARHKGAVTRQLIANVRALTGTVVRPQRHLVTVQHGVTRYRITLQCHVADYVSGRLKPTEAEAAKWVRPADLDEYPLSATGRRLSRLALNT